MSKIYRGYCKVEEFLVGLGFAIIVALTFMNALLRIFNVPIIYADDTCLLLFSWTALIGADVAMRYHRLVGMDILTSKLSPKIQKILGIIVYIIMIVILAVLIKGGIKIIKLNGSRPFNTLDTFGISYGYVTAAIPVCCSMMILTCIIKAAKLFLHLGDDNYNIKKDIPDNTLGEENAGLDQAPISLDDMEVKK